MLRLFRPIVLALTAALALSACAPTAQNTAASLAEQRQRGMQMVQQMDQKGLIIKDKALNNYLKGIANRVSKNRPPGSVPLDIFISKDPSINAGTTGGGVVVFFAGMLGAMENEAQLAAVMAHEIAHIDRGHVQAGQANQQAVAIGAALAQIGAAAAGVSSGVTNQLIGLGAQGFVSNFSRTQETDADNIGMQYLARSGYNALEGAKSFQVLQRIYGNQKGVASFFASHPAPGDRLANLSSQAKTLGATKGRVGTKTHKRATRKLRRQLLSYYEENGKQREAAQIRKNLR